MLGDFLYFLHRNFRRLMVISGVLASALVAHFVYRLAP